MWHGIISLGRQTRSNDVRREMSSPPLDSTHGRTSSGVACHHRLWAAHTVERRLTWHAIIAFGQHKRSNDVRRGMTSPPLDSIDNRQHRAWYDTTAIGQHTVRRRRAWHAIIAFGLDDTVRRRKACHAIIAIRWQTRSNDIGQGMISPPLESTHGRTTSGVA